MRRLHYASAFSCGLVTALVAGCPNGSKGTADLDGDGWDTTDDCDDSDPAVNPGATEVCDDGIDNDCDGVDDVCVNDADADGYAAADDCDDSDPAVNPGATEDCTNSVDDNCDGFITECLDPTLVYAPSNPSAQDAYSAAVFADYIVFGEPAGDGAPVIGDGRVLFFEMQAATVDELDAALTSTGELGQEGAYGAVLTEVGDRLCVGADYQDFGSVADAGKSWCFSEAAVQAASGTLPLGDADYTTAGEQQWAFATTETEADVDGDGVLDLLVYTSTGIGVILGDGTPWSGDYHVPTDADLTLGACAGSSTGWCGFGRASNANAPTTLAISEEGGNPDTISLFSLPLVGSSTAPTATATLDREFIDSASGIELISGSAFGNSDAGEVVFLNGGGAIVGMLTASGPGDGLGYWSATVTNQDSHELLLVSQPFAPSPTGAGQGVVYVFDLSLDGLPTDTEQARFVLVPPDGFFNCGWRARGGIIDDADGRSTIVALSCPTFGGAAYQLDYRPPPAPPVGPGSIYATGPDQYEIRQWVVDAYTSRLEWLMSLAQTERVVKSGATVGWRLHGIDSGSPLFRAGLRTGDVLRRVNGVDVTTPSVVRGLYDAFADAEQLTVAVQRDGMALLLQYAIVP